jgi:hypothetical protein
VLTNRALNATDKKGDAEVFAGRVLGGNTKALPSGFSVSDLNDVVDSINNNFDGGTKDGGLK